jgi:hypothetical protein
MPDRRSLICSDYLAEAVPILNNFYICKVAVDYLSEVHSVLLKMENILEFRLWRIPLVTFLASTESLMKHQAIKRPGAKVVDSIGMAAIELGKLL